MFTTSALLFPSLVCFVWGLILLFAQDKSSSQKALTALLLAAALYFYVEACYVMPFGDRNNFRVLVYLDVLSQFITMCLPPLTVIFLAELKGRRRVPAMRYTSFIPAMFFGSAAVALYCSMGLDRAADFIYATTFSRGMPYGFSEKLFRVHRIVCTKAYNFCLSFELAFVVGYIIFLTRKHKNFNTRLMDFLKGRATVATISLIGFFLLLMIIICGVKIALGRPYLASHFGISSLLSFLIAIPIFIMAYIAVWFPDRDFSMWDFLHPTILPPQLTKSAASSEPVLSGDIAAEEAESALHNMDKSVRTNLSLLSKFVSYMQLEQPYLRPELSISEVAGALHTNRTYISSLVNQNFEMSFREYVNVQRINTAKRLMLAEPNRLLEDVALNSGFSSDSQFVKKFREVEGVSPRTWQSLQR